MSRKQTDISADDDTPSIDEFVRAGRRGGSEVTDADIETMLGDVPEAGDAPKLQPATYRLPPALIAAIKRISDHRKAKGKPFWAAQYVVAEALRPYVAAQLKRIAADEPARAKHDASNSPADSKGSRSKGEG